MKTPASTSHDEATSIELRKDPTLAAEYLRAALAEKDDPRVLLVALRQLAQAHGMAQVARRAKVERESLYRALSPTGNPRLSTLIAVLRGLGLALSVEPCIVVAAPHRRTRRTRGKAAKETASIAKKGRPGAGYAAEFGRRGRQ
jgi:probable addiction module antidote protein